jgi:hypothetical protein
MHYESLHEKSLQCLGKVITTIPPSILALGDKAFHHTKGCRMQENEKNLLGATPERSGVWLRVLKLWQNAAH